MCLVHAVIGLPDWIVLAFLLVTPFSTDIAAGLVRLVDQRIVTVCILPTFANQEVPSAVSATVRKIVLSDPTEEIIIQKQA